MRNHKLFVLLLCVFVFFLIEGCNFKSSGDIPAGGSSPSPSPSFELSENVTDQQLSSTDTIVPSPTRSLETPVILFRKNGQILFKHSNMLCFSILGNAPIYVAEDSPDGEKIYEGWVSPDGMYVAYATVRESKEPKKIWLVNLRNGEKKVVFSMDQITGNYDIWPPSIAQLMWVPSSGGILFNTEYEGFGDYYNHDLFLFDPISGMFEKLFGPGGGGVFNISPDRKKLALITPTSIRITTIRGESLGGTLSFENVKTYSECCYYVKPYWAPDSSFLQVFVPSGDPVKTIDPTKEISVFRISAINGEIERIGSIPTWWNAHRTILFSRNLEWIIWEEMTGPSTDSISFVNVAKIDGSNRTTFGSQGTWFVEWIDNTEEFFFRDYQTGNFHIGDVHGNSREGEYPGRTSTPNFIETLRQGCAPE